MESQKESVSISDNGFENDKNLNASQEDDNAMEVDVDFFKENSMCPVTPVNSEMQEGANEIYVFKIAGMKMFGKNEII